MSLAFCLKNVLEARKDRRQVEGSHRWEYLLFLKTICAVNIK